MDNDQNDHLKAYGLVYYMLSKSNNIEWLLKYRGGAFLLNNQELLITEAQLRGVTIYNVNENQSFGYLIFVLGSDSLSQFLHYLPFSQNN